MLELTEANFDQAIANPQPILIDFWAPWCGPCRALSPILERLAQQHRVAKVNVQDHPGLATRFGVGAIPTVMVFKEGKVVSTVVGLRDEKTLVEMMQHA